ncbi:alpha/beta fold hydrolase [Streptomyces sp. NPDC060194]|uniref:alpha/beta fold hydrolase n=1 Tax=Streptomyces sp. NPDC060194 TaxID=3347069 RepID=UPI0036605681
MNATNTVTANGLQLAYRVEGAADAPPLLLLHGRGGDLGNWDGIIEELARTRRTYALDLRGHGASSWPGTYGFDLMRDDVLAFVDALDLAPLDIVAHSMGGGVALLLAQAAPHLVRRLVLEEPPPLLPLDPPRPHLERPDEELAFDWPIVPDLDRQLNEPDPRWWERLADMTTPTLVIAGGPDSHLDQDRLARFADRIPTGRLLTIPAGHSVHASDPARFLAEVTSFLGIERPQDSPEPTSVACP